MLRCVSGLSNKAYQCMCMCLLMCACRTCIAHTGAWHHVKAWHQVKACLCACLCLSVQDMPRLQSEFGIAAHSVVDTQLCYMMLELVQRQQGLHVPGKQLQRKRLEVLLSAYGLSHPNKKDIVMQTKTNHA